jgi:CIC family chloride channel protein
MRTMRGRNIGRMPVVDRNEPTRLLGVLRRSDLVRAYELARTRRVALGHRARQVQLGAVGDIEVKEYRVARGSACAGKTVAEVAWPKDSLLATVRRGERIVLPHGDTLLREGDVPAVVVEGAPAAEAVAGLCSAREPLD